MSNCLLQSSKEIHLQFHYPPALCYPIADLKNDLAMLFFCVFVCLSPLSFCQQRMLLWHSLYLYHYSFHSHLRCLPFLYSLHRFVGRFWWAHSTAGEVMVCVCMLLLTCALCLLQTYSHIYMHSVWLWRRLSNAPKILTSNKKFSFQFFVYFALLVL